MLFPPLPAYRANVVVVLEIDERVGDEQPARIHDQRIDFLHLKVRHRPLVQVVQPEWIELDATVPRVHDRCYLRKARKTNVEKTIEIRGTHLTALTILFCS